jgi:predicted outer membrane repeat protein
MKQRKAVALVVGALLFIAQVSPGKVIYVDAGATGANNGTSWGDAYVHLQDGITNAVANDEIRVAGGAGGVYCPDRGVGYTPGDRMTSFVLKSRVMILGGFPPGGGTVEERDWTVHQTMLSGDLNGDDNPDTLVQNLLSDATRADNSYNVVYSDFCGSATLLDGLTIMGGQANGAAALANGGGWYSITNSSPTITNCAFTRNAAQTRGGAWYTEGVNCRPTLTGVTFTVNYCANRGAGVAMLNTPADTKLDGCQFSGNYAATHGGAIYLDKSSPQILTCEFSAEYAANGGGIAGVETSSPTIVGASFTGNSGANGGALWMENCQPKVYDSAFTVNVATVTGGACFLSAGQASLTNCDFSGNHANNAGAVYHSNCNVVFDDCAFVENSTVASGGAIYCSVSSPQISRTVFLNNAANSGGAIYNYCGHPKLVANSFIGNHSVANGGAITSQPKGCFMCWASPAYLTVHNCLFSGNYVTGNTSTGGAIANYDGHDFVDHRYTYSSFVNSTFFNNSAVYRGGALFTNHISSTNTVRNCIFYENSDTAGSNRGESAQIHYGTNTVQYNCIQGLSTYVGNGNIGDDPLFVDPVGEDDVRGTLDDDLRLSAGSPCIDTGDNALVPAESTHDLDGNPRILDGNNDGTATVDMGPYERDGGCMPVWVDPALEAAVEATLGITDPNCEEMLQLTTLDATGKGITDLTGLEYAEKLSIVNFNGNDIGNIQPLAELPSLVSVNLGYNEVAALPDLSRWTKIRALYLHGNMISDLSPLAIPEITTLTTLYLYSNAPLPIEAYRDHIPTIKANNTNLANFQYDYGCKPLLAGDVNKDCAVNLTDLAMVASEWLRCTHIYQELCP